MVISNDEGGGEQDTTMNNERWEQSCKLSRKETIGVPSSSGSSNNSIQKSPITDTPKVVHTELSVAQPPIARAKSPVISAFIDQRLEKLRGDYRELDSIKEYVDEGGDSSNTTLDSYCSWMPEEEEYTIERLRKAGPEFQKFERVLEVLVADEDDMVDSESEIVHTGQTQTQTQTQTEGGTQSLGGFYF